MSTWPRRAKIAFIGSHGIRKSTAALSFAACVQRGGVSAELAREVVRDNPLGFNEGASAQAQLWVLMSQVRQELELSPKADVLVTDRGVMDNFAYFIRAARDPNPFGLRPFVKNWSTTYDLVVRLTPDVALSADGIRSTNDAFRDEIEAILDEILPGLVRPERLLVMPASSVTRRFDWWPLAERLAASVGGKLIIV
jgi:nicotinamide riboside kinase